MSTPKRQPKKKRGTSKVHPELEGLDVRLNSYGQISSSVSLDELNAFLNKKVLDKKLSAGEWRKAHPLPAKKNKK